jgi:drug/metabolite transporter (DMT)-like permease
MYGRGDLFTWGMAVLFGVSLVLGCITALARREGMQTRTDSQAMVISQMLGIALGLALLVFAFIHRDIPAYYWKVGLL